MIKHLDLVSLTMEQLSDLLDRKEITSVQLVQEYLCRIEKDNTDGYGLGAVLDTVSKVKLLEHAQELDEERVVKKRSPLHGLPILIKDSIATGSGLGLRTSAGSWVLYDSIPKENAPVVDALLDAGLIILGKANCAAFGNFQTENLPWGWSPRAQTISAYGPTLGAGSSSTGSAHAVAAGFCAAAIGSELRGSIVLPSSFAALFGMKPTTGLISTEGNIPVCRKLESVGPIAKSMWDLAALLDCMIPTGSTQFTRLLGSKDCSKPLNLGAYIGHDRRIPTDEQQSMFEEALQVLSNIHTIKNFPTSTVKEMLAPRDFGGTGWISDPSVFHWSRDIYHEMEEYLEGTNGEIRNMKDVVEWNAAHPGSAFYPTHKAENGQSFFDRALASQGDTSTEGYRNAKGLLENVGKTVVSMMEEEEIDVLVGLATSGLPAVAATIGFPIATAPYKLTTNGEPLGLYFLAKRGRDDLLLRVLSTCEQLFPERDIPPHFAK